MAIYDDNFEGYSVGATPPFGSWVQAAGSLATPTIFAGGVSAGGVASTRALRLPNPGGGVYIDTAPTYHSSFSIFTAFLFGAQGAGSQLGLFRLNNGPDGTGHYVDLLTLVVEADRTLSLYDGNLQFLGNTIDAIAQGTAWNFLQLNVTLSDVTVAGVARVHIAAELALNGRSVLSVNVTTGIAAGGLANGTSEVNRFYLQSQAMDFDNFTLDTLQPIVTYPHAGTPKAIVTQAVGELDILPDSAKVQVIQAPIELDILPDTAKIQVFQAVIELDLQARNRWYISES